MSILAELLVKRTYAADGLGWELAKGAYGHLLKYGFSIGVTFTAAISDHLA